MKNKNRNIAIKLTRLGISWNATIKKAIYNWLTEDCPWMLNVMFLVYSGVNEDHAHALRDTTPCVIGWKSQSLALITFDALLCWACIEDWAIMFRERTVKLWASNDNTQRQISEHIFTLNGGYCVYIQSRDGFNWSYASENIWIINTGTSFYPRPPILMEIMKINRTGWVTKKVCV